MAPYGDKMGDLRWIKNYMKSVWEFFLWDSSILL